MHRKQTILFALAALSLFNGSLLATNVFVLPQSAGSTSGNATVFSAATFQQLATFNISTDAYLVLPRPTVVAGDVRYFVIARSGSASITTLDKDFKVIGTPINLGQNVTAAAVTSDGRRLLVVYGNNLAQYRADTGELIQSSFVDVGITPSDIVVTQDSRRALVFSSFAQKITAIDIESRTKLGEFSLPGLSPGKGFLAMSPTGLAYASAGDRVIEINPNLAVFDNSARRREFSLNNGGGNVGKLAFTPDGTRALAINISPTVPALMYYFQLDYTSSGVSTINNTDPGLTGFIFDKVYVAGNSLGYAITTATASKPRRLFSIAIPPVTTVGSVTAPTITTDDAFFGSLGTIPIVDSLAFSNESPSATRGFVSAPLNLLQPAAQNTIYSVAYSGANSNVVNQAAISYLPGVVTYAGPSSSLDNSTPAGVVRIAGTQADLTSGGVTQAFGVRVINGLGAPMFNVPVVFTPTTTGASVSATTVATNADGIALVTATAPAAVGPFTISASVQGSGLSTAFNFNVAGSSSGGGGGGGGNSGSNRLIVVEGSGQAIRAGEITGTGSLLNPTTKVKVRLLDSAGKPVSAAQLTWKITTGEGRWNDGTQAGDDATARVTITDANGESTNSFAAPSLNFGDITKNTEMSVVSSDGATAPVYITTVQNVTSSGYAILPDALLISPTNEPPSLTLKSGQTLPAAIQVRFGGNIPYLTMKNLGFTISTFSGPAIVECTPNPIPLSDDAGLASCDLTAKGGVGTSRLRLFAAGQKELFVNVEIQPGAPSRLVITNGDQQSGNPNSNLSPLIVSLDDGAGNVLSGVPVRWELLQGQAILVNPTTVTNAQGQAVNTVRIGSTPGVILIRATAIGGSNPSVTFQLRVNVVLSAINKVSGDGQTTFTGQSFAQPLIAEVRDQQNQPVPGQSVSFTVVTGAATLSSGTATTGSDGRAQVTVRAGTTAGAIVINASTPGLPGQQVTFNLTSRIPGPQVTANDFYNSASNERGSVVPGSLFTIVGPGIAPDLRGCVQGNTSQVGPYPTRVANVEVQFGAFLAPILSVCNTDGREQVNFQVPFELAPGGTASVIIRSGASSTTIPAVQVTDLQPGTFETIESTRRYATAVRPNGSFVTPENPARWGETIRFFVTGAGQVTPQAFTGVLGVANQDILAPVVVGLNDAGVRVVSARYQQGAIGVYEIAFEVPEGTQTGPDRPLGIILYRNNQQAVFPANSPTIAIAAQ